tara:strand:+ start:68 stop:493 length:426 start_codon:yes stop_codon:yes gene_type:complete
MALSKEEKKKIYLEEKERLKAKRKIKAREGRIGCLAFIIIFILLVKYCPSESGNDVRFSLHSILQNEAGNSNPVRIEIVYGLPNEIQPNTNYDVTVEYNVKNSFSGIRTDYKAFYKLIVDADTSSHWELDRRSELGVHYGE